MAQARLRKEFGGLISRASRQWRRAVDERLEPFGMTEATWLPLIHLERANEPMRQKDLAASLSLDSSSVVRILNALEASGLIERREGVTDRRAKTINLTKLGRSKARRVEGASSQVRRRVLAELSDQPVDAECSAIRSAR